MTFEGEEVREKFHSLPAQQQLEWCELEIYLARQGKQVHVEEVIFVDGDSEVLVRINEKLKLSVGQDTD